VIEITIAISSRPLPDEWPGSGGNRMQLLAKLPLSNSRVCWAVWRPNPEAYSFLSDVVRKKKAGLGTSTTQWRLGNLDKSKPDTRLIIPLRGSDGTLAFVDAAYGVQAEAA